jgi:N-acetylneuraminic acid mutarotase
VSFEKVPAGLVGVIANRIEEVKGELNGEKYNSAAHYATLTFEHGSSKAASSADAITARGIPPLPEPLASFGAAVADGYLYVYSGHIGGEHEHSKDNLSQHFLRVALDGGEWEELPMQTPLQGLPLAAHDGKLYRVGGLNARNTDVEKEDLHSVAEFACFDPATNEWTALAPLPEPRSSHDAVVIGDVMYVAGGWTLSGSSKGKWIDTAWAYDLSQRDGQWQAIPSPGFRRRALALAEWQGKLVALGGMTEDHDISRSVDVLDLERGEWSKLAELPGEGMDGFGLSAWNLDGKLYASGTQESMYRLSDDGKKWEAVLKLTPPRFFHRLVPGDDGTVLIVGGASEEGHLATIEKLRPSQRPALEQ